MEKQETTNTTNTAANDGKRTSATMEAAAGLLISVLIFGSTIALRVTIRELPCETKMIDWLFAYGFSAAIIAFVRGTYSGMIIILPPSSVSTIPLFLSCLPFMYILVLGAQITNSILNQQTELNCDPFIVQVYSAVYNGSFMLMSGVALSLILPRNKGSRIVESSDTKALEV